MKSDIDFDKLYEIIIPYVYNLNFILRLLQEFRENPNVDNFIKKIRTLISSDIDETLRTDLRILLNAITYIIQGYKK